MRVELSFPLIGTVEAVTEEVTVAGEGCALVLRVFGYERPHEETGSDANWLSASAELRASRTGVFEARHDIALRTEELVQFRDQLVRLLQTLTGEARLAHMEDQVGCAVRLKHGVGELEAFLREEVGAELRVTEARTDQTYLQQALREMDSIVRAFPVKGRGPGW
jgi:hypothetical protein